MDKDIIAIRNYLASISAGVFGLPAEELIRRVAGEYSTGKT
jgi:hypothetical protein